MESNVTLILLSTNPFRVALSNDLEGVSPVKFINDSNNPLLKNCFFLKFSGTLSTVALLNLTNGLNFTDLSSLLMSGIVISGLYSKFWYPGTLVLIIIFNWLGIILLSIVDILIILIYYYRLL